MPLPAIRIEELSKRYRLGVAPRGYRTLRETIGSLASAPLRRLRNLRDGASEAPTIWALKDVNLDVESGDVIGVIGRNGAGKSTLLKVLSRITEPTTGRVEIRGRVASLLEVGTGFHPELTGRENIYLNGAILGMKHAEIQRKFDEIVAFSEVERFIDTSVKRYSSGMYLRLAFAVAANLNPEILLVDEVLAVGDAAFQKKCLGKMESVAGEGRTVFFVSHNMSAIQRFCRTGVLMQDGRIAAHGPTTEVIEAYLKGTESSSLEWTRTAPTEAAAHFERVSLGDEREENAQFITTKSALRITMDFAVRSKCRDLILSVNLADHAGDIIFASSLQDVGLSVPEASGSYRAVMRLPPELLLPKTYAIRCVLWIHQFGVLDTLEGIRFSVHEVVSLSNATPGGRTGKIAIPCEWDISSRG